MSDQRPEDEYGTTPEESVFPAAGERVDDADRQAALEAMPEGNAETGDQVDDDSLDSDAHE